MMAYALSVQKYTDYYLEFVQVASSDEIEAEIETICTALENCYEIAPDWHTISAIADALFSFFKDRGHWALAINVYQMAIEAATQFVSETTIIHHQTQLGYSCYRFGAKDEALNILTHVIDTLKEPNAYPAELLIQAYIHRSECYANLSEWEKAKQDDIKAIELARTLGNQQYLGQALLNAGATRYWQRRAGNSLEYFLQSLDIARELDDTSLEERTLDFIARVYEAQGNFEKAEEIYQACVALARKINNLKSVASGLNGLGTLALSQNRMADAYDYLSQALDICKSADDIPGMVAVHTNLGNVARQLEKYAQAKAHHKQAYKFAKDTHDIRHEIVNLNMMGLVAQHDDSLDQAETFLKESLRLNRKHGYQRGVAISLGNLGVLEAKQDHYQNAVNYYHQCLTIFEALEDKFGSALTHGNIGKMYRLLQNHDLAHQHLTVSIKLAHEIGTKFVVIIDLIQLAALSLPERLSWLNVAYHHPAAPKEAKQDLLDLLAEQSLTFDDILAEQDAHAASSDYVVEHFDTIVANLISEMPEQSEVSQIGEGDE